MARIKIVQKKQKGRTDSVFYEGEIASAENEKYYFSLIATGDICVKLDGEYYGTCHANHRLEDLFGGKIKLTDRKIKALGDAGRLTWENNNWMEVIFRKKEMENWDCDIAITENSYDDGIRLLKDYINDSRFRR